MVMKEHDYPVHDGKKLKLLVCTICNFDTFDKAVAKEHEEGDAHDGPSSEVPK